MAKKVRRKELGAGIAALLGKMDTEAQTTTPMKEVVKELANTVAIISPSQIEVNPHQPRTEFDAEALQELADSIKVYGIIQPLTVRRLAPEQYQLISGERRLRASKIAGLTEIPAYIRLANDQEMMEMALVENLQRENLNPMEMASSLSRLKEEFDTKDEVLATIVGKRRSTITNYLRLLKLPPNIQEALRNEEISMGHAKALVGIGDVIARQNFFTKVQDEHLSVRALENLISEYHAKNTSRKPKAQASTLPNEYEEVQTNLRAKFGNGKLRLKLKSEGKGQIMIPFQSVEELNRILDVIEEGG